MKILLLTPLPPPMGGIATWTQNYLKYSSTIGLECDVINNGLIGKRANNSSLKRNIFSEMLRFINIYKSLKNKIRSFKPEILHLNTSCTNFGVVRDYFCAKYANKKNISIVLHCHCNVEDQLTSKIGRFFFKKNLNISKTVFVLNNKSFNFVKEYKDNVGLIPNFIDSKLECNKKINNDIREILFVGHIIKTKGCDEIIESARFFPDKVFRLVGSVGDEYIGKELPPNVLFEGEKNKVEISQYYINSDLFLFPSYTEGFSISLLEAMSFGLPCLATDVGANKDMIEESGGLIIEKYSPESIIEAIKKLEDIEIRNCMSHWNIEKVKQNYIIEKVMKKIVTIYEEIIANV